VEFLSNMNVKPPLHEHKALPYKRKAWRLSGHGSELTTNTEKITHPCFAGAVFGQKNAFFQNFKQYDFSVVTPECLPIAFSECIIRNNAKNPTKRVNILDKCFVNFCW